MKKNAHPLQSKIDSGELKPVDYFDISDEEFNAKLQCLDDDERQFALQYRQNIAKELGTPAILHLK
jgi:hypothetical protein